MSYYTQYYIEVRYFETFSPIVWERRKEILDKFNNEYNVTTNITGQFMEEWSSCESDMLKLSLEYPRLLFVVNAAGEVPTDLWKGYFHDGNLQYCKGEVVYEQYQKDRL